jgi:hypothetical protein
VAQWQETAVLGGGEGETVVSDEVRRVLQHWENEGMRMEQLVDDGELTERGEDSGSSSEFIIVGGALVTSVGQRVNRGGKDTVASFCWEGKDAGKKKLVAMAL